MNRRALLSIAFALLIAVALAACGSSSKSSGATNTSSGGGSAAASPQSSSTAGITIDNFSFSTTPVKAGSTVTIVNKDSTEHTVTSDDGTSFNVDMPSGQTKTFTAPTKPGTYKFHCNIHSFMTGTLTVQ